MARVRGFTLVEVMVAMGIVALVVPALLFSLSQQIDGTAHMRDRSLAQVVAANRLAELRLALRSGSVRTLRGDLRGSDEMLDRQWFWRIQSSTTEVPDFSRVELQVRLVEEESAAPLYTLVAYLAVGLGES